MSESTEGAVAFKLPELNEGEVYIGARIGPDGKGFHVIKLPGDNDDASWQVQMNWAKGLGGDLPTRVEQAMLWENHRELLQKDVYWSNETDHDDNAYAWCQNFNYGHQYCSHKGHELRAVAVRRLPI